MSAKQATVNSLIAQAEWREGKAEEYPHDKRNPRAAKALRAAAEYVAALPDDDSRLRVLDGARVPDDFLIRGAELGDVLRRVGFHYTLSGGRYPQALDEPEAILDRLAEAAVEDEASAVEDGIYRPGDDEAERLEAEFDDEDP